MKKIISLIVILFSLFFLVNFLPLLNAVAVSGAYSNNKPLEMSPGEIKEFNLILQNLVGDTDVKFKAEIVEGEFVKLVDKNTDYLVPLGSNDVAVGILVEIPKDTNIGTESQVRVAFKPMPIEEKDEGMVQVSLGLNWYFKIKVEEKIVEEPVEISGTDKEISSEKPRKLELLWILIIVVIIITIVLIWSIRKRRKEKTIKDFNKVYQGEYY